MKTTSTYHFAVSAFFAFLVASTSWGAKAPISAAEREKESTHIVTGQVVAIESVVQKSKFEKGIGNKDEIFTIRVKVESATKGEGIAIGGEVQVIAWKSHTRIGAAGIAWQGQEKIPKKGDTAKFYLKLVGKTYEPLMPNGIDIQPPAQNKPGEQAGAGQPATRPESKPEGGDKPQPEAGRRSR